MTQDEWLKKARIENDQRIKLLDGTYNEQALQKGLLIKDYPVKWRQARELALKVELSIPQNYAKTVFDMACQYFVELGGGVDKTADPDIYDEEEG